MSTILWLLPDQRVIYTTGLSHLNDGLGDERVEMGHQFAVDVSHIDVLRHHGDKANRAVTDPQVGVTQERTCNESQCTNSTW